LKPKHRCNRRKQRIFLRRGRTQRPRKCVRCSAGVFALLKHGLHRLKISTKLRGCAQDAYTRLEGSAILTEMAVCHSTTLALALFVGVLTLAPKAESAEPDSSAAAKERAAEHFRKAKSLFGAGDYAHAREELVEAHALDPAAKELILNLSIVSEKMRDYEGAIAYQREVLGLQETSKEERDAAEGTIRRLEGAKRSEESKHAEQEQGTKVVFKTVTVTERVREKPPLSPATVVFGVVTLAALGSGATMGVLALQTKPASGVETGAGYAFTEWRNDNGRAQTFATVSDVSFAVAAGALIATGVFYFLSHKNVQSER
jgi:tetratricopeptide (TPR) repeat protein